MLNNNQGNDKANSNYSDNPIGANRCLSVVKSSISVHLW